MNPTTSTSLWLVCLSLCTPQYGPFAHCGWAMFAHASRGTGTEISASAWPLWASRFRSHLSPLGTTIGFIQNSSGLPYMTATIVTMEIKISETEVFVMLRQKCWAILGQERKDSTIKLLNLQDTWPWRLSTFQTLDLQDSTSKTPRLSRLSSFKTRPSGLEFEDTTFKALPSGSTLKTLPSRRPPRLDLPDSSP